MLAHKAQYFKGTSHYDDFALYGATRVFLRLTDKRQFELKEEGGTEYKLPKIKSVLNYIKSILYPMKVTYEQENYIQTGLKNREELMPIDAELNFSDTLNNAVDELDLVDTEIYLGEVIRTIRAYLTQIPRKRHSCEWMNIYLSCILSFLNMITLCRENKEKLIALKQVVYTKPQLIDKMYRQERENAVILYHLPEEYHDYILVLINRLKRIIARDMSTAARSYVNGTDAARKMMLSSMLENSEVDKYGGMYDE